MYISFSGGKDSTVLLDLVRSEYPNVKAVFVDTGLEYPEIRSFVKTFDNVEILKPKKNFKQVIQEYGYPFFSKENAQKIYEIKHTGSEILKHNRLHGDSKGNGKLALIERESGYHWDKVGDNGNSKGYMQIYEKWHIERMEAEGVTDLFNPYQNIRVGLNCLREIQDKYLASSGENCVLMVYNMGESTAKKLWAKDIYSSAYSREVIARAQELRQELTQE